MAYRIMKKKNDKTLIDKTDSGILRSIEFNFKAVIGCFGRFRRLILSEAC